MIEKSLAIGREGTSGNLYKLTEELELIGEPDYVGHDCGARAVITKSTVDKCHTHALRTFIRNFGIAFGIRAGLSLSLRAFTLMRSNPRALLSLEAFLGEGSLRFRTDGVRWGLFAGGATGGFSAVHCVLKTLWGTNQFNSLIAGCVAGLSLCVHTRETRRTLSLYALARMLQCLYNEAKRRKLFTPLQHGDSLLFILSSAQIMYAYVMRPETLPASYWNFIVRSGPIRKEALLAVRANNRGQPLQLETLSKFVSTLAVGDVAGLADPFPSAVGCNILHPQQTSCVQHCGVTLFETFKKLFPLHATLTLVPMVVLQLFRVLHSPLKFGWFGFMSASRSCLFLSSFCTLYQGVVCLHRHAFEKDHKLVYYLAGVVSSLAIFIERKSRRAELALYALPRAADSFFTVCRENRWLASVPQGELLLFAASVGGLMHFYHEHPHEIMSPLLNNSFNFLFQRTKSFSASGDDKSVGSASSGLSTPGGSQPGTPTDTDIDHSAHDCHD